MRQVMNGAGPRIVIVPGLAVRTYALDAVRAARSSGYDVHLLRAPAWRGAPADLGRYGVTLAADLASGRPVDLLVGLSVGSQAAAVAASLSPNVRALLLVSPTVDPVNRSWPELLAAWARGEPGGDRLGDKLADWSSAGLPRIVAGFASALSLPIENVLARVTAPLTVVHAGLDNLGTEAFARSLGGRTVVKPRAAHSWPVGDPMGFVELLDRITAREDDA